MDKHQAFAMSPGIYLIKNGCNGLVYVGSSKFVRRRVIQHINSLRKGKHHNVRLQSDWDNFGEAAFDFSLVCGCEITQLANEEMRVFREYGLPDVSKGYNCDDTYPYHPGKRRTDKALARLAEIRDLHPEWKEKSREALRKNNPVIKIVSPDGAKTFDVTLRVDFAREMGLSPKTIYALVSGTVKHVKGWALAETPRTKIYDPEGKEWSFVSSRFFKKWIGAPKLELAHLLSGEARTSKRWSLDPKWAGWVQTRKAAKPVVDQRKKIVLLNLASNLTNEFPSRKDAAKFLNVHKTDIYAMLRGSRKTIKGWRICR